MIDANIIGLKDPPDRDLFKAKLTAVPRNAPPVLQFGRRDLAISGYPFDAYLLQREEVTAVLFGLLPNHGNSHMPLTARIESKDGSIVLVRLADVEMVFRTAFGDNTRIQLSHIRRMENIAHLHTLRGISRLNKFRLHCIDDNEIIGNLVSPVRLEVTILGVTQESGKVKVAEIDSLEVLPDSFSRDASVT